MSVLDVDPVADEPAARSEPDGPKAGPSRLRRAGPDALVFAGFVAAAVYLYGHVWWHPSTRYLVHSYNDHYQFKWFFAANTHAFLGLHNPFFNDLQNASTGVNMMGNTSVLGLSLPLVPVTVLFGPSVTWVVAATLCLSGTAFAWYWLMHRSLGVGRAAAVLGGAFCAFAPAIVSHANGHLQLVSMFLVPWIVHFSLRLFRSQRPVRDGLWLGLLIVYQVFLGEEILLIAAMALGLFVVLYALPRLDGLRAMVRPFLTGLGTALAVSVPLLAYPLYLQFFGRQHYDELGDLAYVTNDLNTFTEYATRSLGNQGAPLSSTNFTEENTYFGWPLLILALAITVWLWRDRLVRTCALLAVVCGVLSLGPAIQVRGADTGVPGPWAVLKPLPVLEAVNVGRLTFVSVAALGVLLAVATDRVLRASATSATSATSAASGGPRGGVPMRLLWIAAVAAALLPLAPLPLLAEDRPVAPKFFSDGTYRQYIGKNHTMVPIPDILATADVTPLMWQVAAHMDFRVPEGYIVGPVQSGATAAYSPAPSTMALLTREVRRTGKPVAVSAERRDAILAELRRWQADAVVLYDDPALPQLRETLDPLLGPVRRVDDVWLWDVRPLTRA
jgi:hypothetical protein